MGRKKLPVPLPKAPPKPKGGAYSRFGEMSVERQNAVDMMLAKGDPPRTIAKTIQEDWKHFADIKPMTLEKQLQRYRDSQLMPRLAHMQEKQAMGAIGQDQRVAPQAAKAFQRLNVMEHWEEIIGIQRDRILKAYTRERGLPVTTDAVTKLLKDYNHSLAQYTDLQLETGYLKRAPKVLTGQIGIGSDPDDGRPIFEFAIEQQQVHRGALADMSDLLKEVLEGECSRVEPDGGDLPEASAPAAQAGRKSRR